MKSSKDAHKVMHRRTNPPPIGETTVRNWRRLHKNMVTVASEEEVAKKMKGRTRSQRLSEYQDEIKPPTFKAIWPGNNDESP